MHDILQLHVSIILLNDFCLITQLETHVTSEICDWPLYLRHMAFQALPNRLSKVNREKRQEVKSKNGAFVFKSQK